MCRAKEVERRIDEWRVEMSGRRECRRGKDKTGGDTGNGSLSPPP
jgi:hypothetical protein